MLALAFDQLDEYAPNPWAAVLVALFAPAFVLLGVWGAVALIRRRSLVLLPVLAGMLITSLWFPRGMPKFFLAAVPG